MKTDWNQLLNFPYLFDFVSWAQHILWGIVGQKKHSTGKEFQSLAV